MIAPPTDSLYKFLAISGLVVLGWSVAFPWTKHIDYALQIADTRAAVRTSAIKVEQLKALNDRLTNEEQALTKDVNTRDRRIKSEAIEARRKEIYIQILEAQQPVEGRAVQLEVLNGALRSYYLMGAISVAAGAILTVAGFFLWYRRVQKFVDEQVRNGAAGNNAPTSEVWRGASSVRIKRRIRNPVHVIEKLLHGKQKRDS